jgi:hypothetical protein
VVAYFEVWKLIVELWHLGFIWNLSQVSEHTSLKMCKYNSGATVIMETVMSFVNKLHIIQVYK